MKTIGYAVLFEIEGLIDARTFWVEEDFDAERDAIQFGAAMDNYVVLPIDNIFILASG